MKRQLIILPILFLMSTIPQNGWCSIRYENYKGGAVNVNVSFGRTSEVNFPEDIAQLLRSQVPGSVDLEVKGKSLYILPKIESNVDIFVRTVSNIEIPIHLIFGNPHDVRVQISYGFDQETKFKTGQKKSSQLIELMKNLIKGQEILGATKKEVNEVIFANKYFKAVLLTRYELNRSEGMVVEIENLLNRTMVTPVQQISLKNLMAISADSEVLAPNGTEGSKTMLYLVLRK